MASNTIGSVIAVLSVFRYLHEIGDAALVAVFENAFVRVARAFVGKYESYALVQIRKLAHAAAHDVGLKMRILEYARIRLKADLRAALSGVAQPSQAAPSDDQR